MLLHGWPGDRWDYRDVVALLRDRADLVVPDLRGFGDSDKHDADLADQYSAAAQARSVVALMDELDIDDAVLAGYDVGSRVAQALANHHPHRVRGLASFLRCPGWVGASWNPLPRRNTGIRPFTSFR